jgi:hypothetical protein
MQRAGVARKLYYAEFEIVLLQLRQTGPTYMRKHSTSAKLKRRGVGRAGRSSGDFHGVVKNDPNFNSFLKFVILSLMKESPQ